MELQISQTRAKVEQKKLALEFERQAAGGNVGEDNEKRYKEVLDKKNREMSELAEKQRRQIASLTQIKRSIENELEEEKQRLQQLSMQLSALKYASPTIPTRTIKEEECPSATHTHQHENTTNAMMNGSNSTVASQQYIRLQAELEEIKQKREEKSRISEEKCRRELNFIKLEMEKEKEALLEAQGEMERLKQEIDVLQQEQKKSIEVSSSLETQIRQLSKDMIVRSKVLHDKISEQNKELTIRRKNVEDELQAMKQAKENEQRHASIISVTSDQSLDLLQGNKIRAWGSIRKQAEEVYSARAAENSLLKMKEQHKKLEIRLKETESEIESIRNLINTMEVENREIEKKCPMTGQNLDLSKDEINALKMKVSEQKTITMQLMTSFEAASEDVNRVAETLRIAVRRATDQKDVLDAEEQRLKMMNTSGKHTAQIVAQNLKIEKEREEFDSLSNIKMKAEDELKSLQAKMNQAKTAMENGMHEAAYDEMALQDYVDKMSQSTTNTQQTGDTKTILTDKTIVERVERSDVQQLWDRLYSVEQVKEDIELRIDETEDIIQKLEFKKRLAREHMAYCGNLEAEDMGNFSDVAELSHKHTSLIALLGEKEIELSAANSEMEAMKIESEKLNRQLQVLFFAVVKSENLYSFVSFTVLWFQGKN